MRHSHAKQLYEIELQHWFSEIAGADVMSVLCMYLAEGISGLLSHDHIIFI